MPTDGLVLFTASVLGRTRRRVRANPWRRGSARLQFGSIMKLRYLAVLVAAFSLQDFSAEGTRWWSHVEFLASDDLQGRDVGSPGFEKAASYVEGQFREIGLKPGGVSGYRQPVKLESRVLVPDDTTLSLARNGEAQPLVPREDATMSARGELDGSIDAPMVFIGYGLSIPEAKWDDLAGLDLHGKIA